MLSEFGLLHASLLLNSYGDNPGIPLRSSQYVPLTNHLFKALPVGLGPFPPSGCCLALFRRLDHIQERFSLVV